MNSVIPILNIISALFAISGMVLVLTKRVSPSNLDTRFIIAGGCVLLLIGTLNFLEHTSLAVSPDIGENFLILLFFPIGIFAVYSSAVRQEFNRRRLEETKAAEVLKESEEKYKLLFTKSPLPKSIFDPKTLKFIEANDAALELYGYTRDDIDKVTLLDIHPPEEIDRLVENNAKYLGKAAPTSEWRNLKKNGDVIIVEVSTSIIHYLDEEYRLAVIKDITAQRKAEEKVFSAFVEGENKERDRLARELHDGIGQYLAATSMNLDAMKKEIQKLGKREQSLFENGLSYLKQAMTETRNLSHNLMPSIIEDYGLDVALKNLTDDFGKSSGIDCQFYCNLKHTKPEKKQEFNIYRIVQECLNNISKHSKATKVNVQLIKDEFDLILTIEDNGIGIDTSHPSYVSGLGLNTIKTRTFIMGGVFDIETSKNKGTLISISVPITTS